MKNARIIVATHKEYRMPEDAVYMPLHVGRAGKADIGFAGDDTGDNISEKNKGFCELTGLYWAHKNLDADYIGLAHYRRHFAAKGARGDKWARVITGAELQRLLEGCDVLLPRPRNYFIETGWSQYAHAHHEEDLIAVRGILAVKYPEYLTAFDNVMKRTKGHRFNMFVMKRELSDMYCSWLFDVLFELERRLDISSYSPYDARVFGFVGERLLDVWLTHNAVPYKDIPVVYMESQNWPRKCANFLKRKLAGGKRRRGADARCGL